MRRINTSYFCAIVALFTFLTPLAFAGPQDFKKVSIVDLSAGMGLPIETLYADDFRSSPSFKGQFFKYMPFPGENPTRGVLIPLKDQAKTFARDHPNFGAFVIHNSIPADAAASLLDRVYQIARLQRDGGPRVHAIALIRDNEEEDALTEVGLIVDHIQGSRIPRNPEDRLPAVNVAFLDLFRRISHPLLGSEAHALPLDFHPDNVLWTEVGIRPVDAVIATREDASATKLNPHLHHLRLHQAAYTLISIEDSIAAAGSFDGAEDCHRILGLIRNVYEVPDNMMMFVRTEIAKQRSQERQLVSP